MLTKKKTRCAACGVSDGTPKRSTLLPGQLICRNGCPDPAAVERVDREARIEGLLETLDDQLPPMPNPARKTLKALTAEMEAYQALVTDKVFGSEE